MKRLLLLVPLVLGLACGNTVAEPQPGPAGPRGPRGPAGPPGSGFVGATSVYLDGGGLGPEYKALAFQGAADTWLDDGLDNGKVTVPDVEAGDLLLSAVEGIAQNGQAPELSNWLHLSAEGEEIPGTTYPIFGAGPQPFQISAQTTAGTSGPWTLRLQASVGQDGHALLVKWYYRARVIRVRDASLDSAPIFDPN